MDRIQRIAFRDNWLEQKNNGTSISVLFNNNARILSKDSSFRDMMVAECCKIDKDPSRIPHIYEEFCKISDPTQRLAALSSGFKILVPRYLRTPQIFDEWFALLTGSHPRDDAWIAERSIRATFKQLCKSREHGALIHFLDITPPASREGLETMMLDLVLSIAWSKPDFFRSIVSQLTTLPSTVKLKMYLECGGRLEKRVVALCAFQSLEPQERAGFFVQRAHYFAKQRITVAEVIPFWKEMLPYVADGVTKHMSSKGDMFSLVRVILPTALTVSREHFDSHNATVEDIPHTRKIMTLINTEHLSATDVQHIMALENTIQNMVLNHEIDHTTLQPSRRKM